MKIGIITHYDVHNHGAILQLNALIKVLRENNCDAKALRFEKNYDFLGVDIKDKYNISLRSIPVYIKYLLNKGLKKTLFNIKKRNILEKFKKDNKLIGNYYTEAEIDLAIIGSDEVFALHTGPTPVFFGHALPCHNIISYAGCFGPTNYDDIVEKGCLSFVKSGIESMLNVSVRDQNSLEIIIKLTGKKPTLVCDPVLLYGYVEEISKMAKINLPKYLLVYSYDNNMNSHNEIDILKKFAKSRNLKIVSPGFYHKWCDYNINVTPEELLNYFKCAEYVVTDTFHGSVLSLVTQTDFAVIPRGNTNKLCNLLNEYNLKSRISNNNLSEIFENRIDYDLVSIEIKKRRSESMDFLLKSIQ